MKKIDEIAIIGRIKKLRENFSGPRGKSKFAASLGISPSTYNYYETTRVPPIDILVRICEVTGADLHWLVTGGQAEKKFAFAENNSDIRDLTALLGENPELMEPVSAFVEVLCEKKNLEKELSGQAEAVKSPSNREASFQSQVGGKTQRPAWIPVLGRTAAGIVHFWDQTLGFDSQQAVTELDELVRKHIGKEIVGCADGMVTVDLQAKALVEGVRKPEINLVQVRGGEHEAGQVVEFVESEEIFRLYPDSFALQIDGDSMAPKINDGDIVILSPSVPAVQGQIAVASVANQIGVTCKLIRTAGQSVHLIPVNERYPTKVIDNRDLRWALAVLCHIRV